MEERCENCLKRFEQPDLLAAHRKYVSCSLGLEKKDRLENCKHYTAEREE